MPSSPKSSKAHRFQFPQQQFSYEATTTNQWKAELSYIIPIALQAQMENKKTDAAGHGTISRENMRRKRILSEFPKS